MINSISYKFRGFERLRTAERKGKSRKKKSAFSLSQRPKRQSSPGSHPWLLGGHTRRISDSVAGGGPAKETGHWEPVKDF